MLIAIRYGKRMPSTNNPTIALIIMRVNLYHFPFPALAHTEDEFYSVFNEARNFWSFWIYICFNALHLHITYLTHVFAKLFNVKTTGYHLQVFRPPILVNLLIGKKKPFSFKKLCFFSSYLYNSKREIFLVLTQNFKKN